MITPTALINKFWDCIYAKWGYIWGTAGVMWTAAKQAAIEKTTDADREMSRKYGSQWIGHMVADCSGLFHWAFAQLGGYMYHGSNTMWDKYCQKKGELRNGKRTDGQELKLGSAVFTHSTKTGKRGHVGLFVGDGTVIEAEGAKAGVVTSKVTKSKWVEWGELRGVDYSAEPGPGPSPEPTPPAGKAIVTGKNVALREGPSKSTRVQIRIATGTMVDIAEITGWTYVKYYSYSGFMMNDFIEIGPESVKVTGKNVAVRAGVGTNTRVLTRIRTGTTVPRQQLPDGWEFIRYGGRTGFMMKEFIKESES